MGYAFAASGSGTQARRFGGICTLASAAGPPSPPGPTYWPALFWSIAISTFANLANAYSMYPMAPGVCLMVAVTPSFFGEATNLSLFGQFTVVPAPGPFFHSGLIAERCEVNTKVVPLESARRTTVMARSGSLIPGFAAWILGSFHLVIVPRKIAGYTSRGSFSSLGLPGRL